MKEFLKISAKRVCFVIIVSLFLIPGGYTQVNAPSGLPDRIILNPTADPSASVAVTWRTDTTIHLGFCEWQLSSGTKVNPDEVESLKATAQTTVYEFKGDPRIVANQYSCTLRGLLPGVSYVYRVGAGTCWSEWFEFKTMADSEEKFSFIYFGDPQIGLKSEWPRVIRKAYQQLPDCRFMLYAGDLINRAERDVEWDEWFKAGSYLYAMVPQIMTPGNHDYNGLSLDSHWNKQFTLPSNGPAGLDGTCYFIDYPNLRLISFDSAAGSELRDEKGILLQAQKSWLDSVLQTNTKKWVIVTTHLPFYSTKESRDNPQLRRNFQPLLEKYKVDLVLTGHDHSYGRGRASDNPDIKPTVVYVVSVGGPKQYPSGNKKWMEKNGSNMELFQTISIDGKSLSFKSYTADGSLFDEFRIDRKNNGAKRFVDSKIITSP
jgi:hypothetical protein